MPLYDFRCTNEKCRHEQIDVQMSLTEYTLKKDEFVCEQCGSPSKQAIAPRLFQLKGPNWYRDGYYNQDYHEQQEALKEYDENTKQSEKMLSKEENLDAV